MAAGHPFVITKHESRYGTVVHLSISEWLVELPETHDPKTDAPLVSGKMPDWTRIPLCGTPVKSLPFVGLGRRHCLRCEAVLAKIRQLHV